MNLRQVIRCGLTLEQVENHYRQGVVNQHVYEAYCKIWRNAAFRFSSVNASYIGAISNEKACEVIKACEA